jgi:hypothetical protein
VTTCQLDHDAYHQAYHDVCMYVVEVLDAMMRRCRWSTRVDVSATFG